MARLKKPRIIKWASVEFQPDLKKLIRPVKLGAVLVEERGASVSVLVIGRIPLFDSRPAEFQATGEITMKIAANWVDSMSKDIRETTDGDIFGRLAQRWRWNLYITRPKTMRAVQGTLEVVAKRLYERLTGQPFEQQLVLAEPVRRADVPTFLPPAWELEEWRKLGQAVAA